MCISKNSTQGKQVVTQLDTMQLSHTTRNTSRNFTKDVHAKIFPAIAKVLKITHVSVGRKWLIYLGIPIRCNARYVAAVE